MTRSAHLPRLALAAVALVVAVGPGWAESLPVVDIDALCAQGFKGSANQRDQCVRANQAAYDEMKPVWDEIPDQVSSASIAEVKRIDSKSPWFYVYLNQIATRRLRTWQAEHPEPAPRFQP